LWNSGWLVSNLVLLGASLCLLPFKRTGPIVAAAVFILAYFVIRAALGMTRFNVEDRYISYLWGLYALGLAICAEGVWARAITLKPLRFVLPCLLIVLVAVAPLQRFFRTFTLDVQEMNDIVVQPSQWMARHLPDGSRIYMEPAGAIRVFTDFYLVDAIGLTTTHFHEHDGDFYSFLKYSRVDYVFDYPKRNPAVCEEAAFENLKTFTPSLRRHSHGMIGVYRVLPTDQIQIKSPDS
jgi:hypothetical protein